MGLLDSVVGSLAVGGTAPPMGGVLSSLPRDDWIGGFGMGGGLGSLMSSFGQGGLGYVAQSWIGDGPNQPISPQRLQGVLGQDQIRSMASQAGTEPNDLLSQPGQHLPNALLGTTRNGRIPDEGQL